jgi:response regulator RpfG family c-di-GMP phosphodiesterase
LSIPVRRDVERHRIRLAGRAEAIARWRAAFEAAGLVADADLEDADVVLLALDGDPAGAPLLLREQRLLSPGLPVLVVGRVAEPALVCALWRAGADDVLFEDGGPALLEALGRALERHRLDVANQETLERYTSGLGERSRRLESALLSLDRSCEETLRSLIRALDAREQETAGHSHRVALWTLHFALVAGVPEEQLLDIHRGALLHDVGKIGIPDPILLKRGELTEDEWTVMRTHPRIGFEILSQAEHLRAASVIPFSHHERWGGGGYPRGLSGEEIPLGARLFAIVDVYDALRSERPYKKALDHTKSIALVRRAAGSHLDPKLVETFVALPEETWTRLTSPELATMTFPQLRELVRSAAPRPEGATAVGSGRAGAEALP